MRNSRLKLQEWALPRLVKRAVKRQRNKRCKRSNRVSPPYSKLNRLAAVPHNKAWASKHNSRNKLLPLANRVLLPN